MTNWSQFASIFPAGPVRQDIYLGRADATTMLPSSECKQNESGTKMRYSLCFTDRLLVRTNNSAAPRTCQSRAELGHAILLLGDPVKKSIEFASELITSSLRDPVRNILIRRIVLF